MEYHNGYFYCPCSYSGKWGIMVFDTLLNSICGIPQMQYTPIIAADPIVTYPWTHGTNVGYSQVNSTLSISNYANPASNLLCSVVGENEIADGNNFQIYPNPTTRTFTITTQLQNSQIEIYNLLGEKIYSAAYCGLKTVDCELFPKGIYFVKLQMKKEVQ